MPVYRYIGACTLALIVISGSLVGCGPAATATETATSVPVATIEPTTQAAAPTEPPIETPEPRPMATDLDLAREALRSYFAALNKGRYDEAVTLYGGSYEILQGWQGNVPALDHATLWERSCGLVMCLQIKNIVEEQAVSDDTFQFLVEFQQDDGSLFVLGPCCGSTEAEMPPVSQFPYTVKKVDGRYLVQEIPVYVP